LGNRRSVGLDECGGGRDGAEDRIAAGGNEGAHNFYGSEAAVIAAVAGWINTGKAPDYINQERTQQ
jgi:hypothetical protein